jgi:hypothetical protein
MSANDLTLPVVYADPAVQAFGKALRAALSFEQDYASLMDFENAETPEAFGEATKKLLRRNHNKEKWPKPTASELERLMALAKTDHEVRILRAAIISYGLARWDKKAEENKT